MTKEELSAAQLVKVWGWSASTLLELGVDLVQRAIAKGPADLGEVAAKKLGLLTEPMAHELTRDAIDQAIDEGLPLEELCRWGVEAGGSIESLRIALRGHPDVAERVRFLDVEGKLA